MPMQKLVAKDALHISSVKADTIRPGETFEVEENDARSLIERGLAEAVKNSPPKVPTARKAAKAPANKQAPEHKNK